MFIIAIVIAVVIILFVIFMWLYSRLTSAICKCSRHLVGKVVIVTGANSGIGYETAKDLAARGARVILACRNEHQATKARDEIISATGNSDVHFKHLNLASLASVRAFAENILLTEKRLDILVNNAGICAHPKQKTEDGLLLEMQTNYFGPFLLTNLLLPLIKRSAPSRIINVTSMAYKYAKLDLEDLNLERASEETFNSVRAYANSKWCIYLSTRELSHRLAGSAVTVNCLHPGLVITTIMKHKLPMIKFVNTFLELFLKTKWEGAQTIIYLAVSPEVDKISGHYFKDCRKVNSKLHQDPDLERLLWEASMKIVHLKT